MQPTSGGPVWLGMLLAGVFGVVLVLITGILLVVGREVPANIWYLDFMAGGAMFGGAVPFGHLSTLGQQMGSLIQHQGRLTDTINHALSKVPVRDGMPMMTTPGTPITSHDGNTSPDAVGGEH